MRSYAKLSVVTRATPRKSVICWLGSCRRKVEKDMARFVHVKPHSRARATTVCFSAARPGRLARAAVKKGALPSAPFS